MAHGTGAAPVVAPAAQAPQLDPAAQRAKKAGVILAICAGLLGITLFTNGWVSASEGRDHVSAGLLSMEGCRGTRCESIDWARAAKRLDIPSDVEAIRYLGLLGGLAAVGMMGFAAAQALGRKPDKIPLRVTEGVMGVAAFGLTFYVMRMIAADHDVQFMPSWGAVVGVGSLIAGSIVLRKQLKPLVAAAKLAPPTAPIA